MTITMSNNVAIAIVLLAIVIIIIGGPFAVNEYNKWQEREMFRQLISEKTTPSTVTEADIIEHNYASYVRASEIFDAYWCRVLVTSRSPIKTMGQCYKFSRYGSYVYDLETGFHADGTWELNNAGQYVTAYHTITFKGNRLEAKDDTETAIFLWTGENRPF